MELKEEETRLEQESEKATDPFETNGVNKSEVLTKLRSVEDTDAVTISMHEIQKQWCKDEKEWRYTKGVQDVLKRMKWKKDEYEEGGITWIGLFAIYALHGGGEREKGYDVVHDRTVRIVGGNEPKEWCRTTPLFSACWGGWRYRTPPYMCSSCHISLTARAHSAATCCL